MAEQLIVQQLRDEDVPNPLDADNAWQSYQCWPPDRRSRRWRLRTAERSEEDDDDGNKPKVALAVSLTKGIVRFNG